MKKCTVKVLSKNKYLSRTVVLIANELGFDGVEGDINDGNINIIDSSFYIKGDYDPQKCIFLFESGEAIPKGAKILLSKPFSWNELRGAIKNVYADLYGKADKKIIIDGNSLIYSGKKLVLSDTEFALFYYLYKRENTPVSREELLENVWNGKNSGTNITDVYINYIRHKIRENFALDTIKAVRGVGYMYTYEK